MGFQDILFTFLGAWLFALLLRWKDILILFKSEAQRTIEERKKIKGGLLREALAEFLIIVPASTALALLLLPLFFKLTDQLFGSLTRLMHESSEVRRAVYTLAGVVSYNFPFVAIKQITTLIVINAIEQFAKNQKSIEREGQLPEKPISTGKRRE